MLLKELSAILDGHPESRLRVLLPSGEFVPDHFHITEVGRVAKKFIDCGGTVRSSVCCSLQLWTAQDFDHRLACGKLGKILQIAEGTLGSFGLPVEVEYEDKTCSTYVLDKVDVLPDAVVLVLGVKHTDCLAPDKCGIPCCSGNICC